MAWKWYEIETYKASVGGASYYGKCLQRSEVSGPLKAAVCIALFSIPSSAHAQFRFCEEGSIEAIMEDYSELLARMENKFEHYWYKWDNVHAEMIDPVSTEDVFEYLEGLQYHKAAVQFFAKDPQKFCSWTFQIDHLQKNGSRDRRSVRYVEIEFSTEAGFSDAILGLRRSIASGVRSSPEYRPPIPSRAARLVRDVAETEDFESLLNYVSRLLIPEFLAEEILHGDIDTLIVVPIGVADRTAGDGQTSAQLVSGIGTIPFSLLTLGLGEIVLDYASVVIAPGLDIFLKPAEADFPREIVESVIVGNPRVTNQELDYFPDLPYARQEADEVAQLLEGSTVFKAVGKGAVEETVWELLSDQGGDLDLIHIAAHGTSSGDNPLDGSYLAMTSDDPDYLNFDASDPSKRFDGRLTAREISRMDFGARPLVVMSACESALGKEFDAGTIGLARAWTWAGASAVVASLWKIDDLATKELMVDFVREAQSRPPDQALQTAMQATRERYMHPKYWAGFNVFGGL